MQETLVRLFRYKAWVNEELSRTLETLADDSHVIPLAVKALSHSYVVDRIFAARLRCQAHDYRDVNPVVQPGLRELSAQMKQSDQDYVDYVSTLSAEALSERLAFTFTDGAPGCMSREEILLHVITHGVGHRGQVSALMLLNAQAPAHDGFTTYLHLAEAAERGRGARPRLDGETKR